MTNTTGLILSGGGARAAYQVGVLAAIARMHDGLPAAESSGGITRVGFSLQAKPAAA